MTTTNSMATHSKPTTILLSSTAPGSGEGPSARSSGKWSNTNSPSYAVKTAKQLTAGALSGVVEVSCTYPTDYVKIMLQLDEGRSGQARRFRNSADVIRQTLKSHGVIGLYRGFSIVFYGAFPKYMFR